MSDIHNRPLFNPPSVLILLGVLALHGTAVFLYVKFTAQDEPARADYTYQPVIPAPQIVRPPAQSRSLPVVYRPAPTPAPRPAVARPPARTVTPQPQRSPVTVQRQTTAPVPAVSAHVAAAHSHAENYFRFKYNPGSSDIHVTDVNIALDPTHQVVGWGERHRTTGEAMIAYYMSPGRTFRRTNRKFEILTDVENGQIKVLDLTLK